MPLGFGEALGLSALGGAFGLYGSQQTNAQNLRIARERMDFEAEQSEIARNFSRYEAATARGWSSNEARVNRAFQEQMSNTAVSRRMDDLINSGINPMLAASQDATTPAGGIGPGATASTAKGNSAGYTARNEFSDALQGASSVMTLLKQKAEIDNINANTGFTSNKTDMTSMPASLLGFLGNYVGKGLNDAGQYVDAGYETFANALKGMKDLPQRLSNSGFNLKNVQEVSDEMIQKLYKSYQSYLSDLKGNKSGNNEGLGPIYITKPGGQ